MDDLTQKNCQLFTVDNAQYLLTNGPDHISQCLRNGQVWEPQTLAISQLLIEGIHAPKLIDIGANLGAWSIPMGHYIRDAGGEIHAWEPQRQVYYQLCANLFVNNLTHCFAHHHAIGDYLGEIDVPVLDVMQDINLGAVSLLPDIYQMQRNTKSAHFEKVPITTLDILALPRVDLIKIDVEGMEYEVLSGGKNWLKNVGYPPIIFEIWGDVVPATAKKQQKLLSMISDEMNYEVAIIGEIVVAQQKKGKRLKIILNEQGYSLKRTTSFEMDFLSDTI